MALIVKNNMDSVNALKQLSKNNEAMNKDLQKLASGEKITSCWQNPCVRKRSDPHEKERLFCTSFPLSDAPDHREIDRNFF